MNKKINHLNPILVDFEDASATTEPFHLIKANKGTGKVFNLTAIGFLIHESAEAIMIAGDCFFRDGTEDRFRKVVAIPKKFINRRVNLRPVKHTTDVVAVLWSDLRYTDFDAPKAKEVFIDEYPAKNVYSVGKFFSGEKEKTMLYQTENKTSNTATVLTTIPTRFIEKITYLEEVK